MRAKALKAIIMSGDYDDMTVKELASFIRELEASTDNILKNIKEKKDATVKLNR